MARSPPRSEEKLSSRNFELFKFVVDFSIMFTTLRQITPKNKQLEEFNKKWKNFTQPVFFFVLFVSV